MAGETAVETETAVAEPMYIPSSEVPPEPVQDPELDGEIDDGHNVHPDEPAATPGADKKVESLGYAVANMQKALPDIVGKAVADQMSTLQEQMKGMFPQGKGEGGEQPPRSDGSVAPVAVEAPEITLDLEGLDPEDFVDILTIKDKVMPAVQKMVEQQLAALSANNGGATTQNAEDVKGMVEKLVSEGIANSHAQASAQDAQRQQWDDSYDGNYPDLVKAGVTSEQFREAYQANHNEKMPSGTLEGDDALAFGETVRDLTYHKLLAANPSSTTARKSTKKPVAKPPRRPVGTEIIDPAANTRSGTTSGESKPAMWGQD